MSTVEQSGVASPARKSGSNTIVLTQKGVVVETKPPADRDDGFSDEKTANLILALARNTGAHLVKVRVANGMVMLEGWAENHAQRDLLHKFVMNLPGVRALKDKLSVRAETLSDKEIALHATQALEAHADLPCGTITVSVAEGVATLRGHVRNAHENKLAEQVASRCRGVTHVVNNLTVDVFEEMSDEATVRAIHGALAYCEEFETDGITVSCADGHVCLRGIVPSLMDSGLAESVARVQAGVRSVENHITVSAGA